MLATIFFAQSISYQNDILLTVEEWNNTFIIPFAPTLFSLDLALAISGMDRSKEHLLTVNFTDEENNTFNVLNVPVPIEDNYNDLYAVKFTGSVRNITILNKGMHKVEIRIDDEKIGESFLNFIVKK